MLSIIAGIQQGLLDVYCSWWALAAGVLPLKAPSESTTDLRAIRFEDFVKACVSMFFFIAPHPPSWHHDHHLVVEFADLNLLYNIPFAIHHYHLCLCVQPQTLLVKSQIVQSISNKPPIILQYLGDNPCSRSFPWMSTPQCLWSKIHILIKQRHDYHALLSISFGSMPYTYPRWNVIKMLKSAAQIHLIHTKPPCSSIMFLFL